MSNPYNQNPQDQPWQNNQQGYGEYGQQPSPYTQYDQSQSGQYPQSPPPDYGMQPPPPQPQPYNANPYAAQGSYGVAQPAERGSGLAIAGLVLGIIGIVTAFFGCGGLLGIVGIVLSVMGRRSVSRRTMATIGLVLSIIAVVIGVGWLILIIVAAANGSRSPTY